jgi:hypothetical protein
MIALGNVDEAVQGGGRSKTSNPVAKPPRGLRLALGQVREHFALLVKQRLAVRAVAIDGQALSDLLE